MLSWYRSQIKEHGFFPATFLLLRLLWARFTVALANRTLPATHACPCCGWEGRRFHDYIELGYSNRGSECPQCQSHPRHRKFFLWLKNEFQPGRHSGTALLFAPERALAPLWDAAPHLRVIRVDIEPFRDVDLLADLQRLPFASDSVDIAWCHHVLEEVEDDRAALRELCRVLKPTTGELIISSSETAVRTTEFGEQKKELSYIWRAYGNDFSDRLVATGMDVRTVDVQLSAEDVKRYGAYVPEKFYRCTKAESSNLSATSSTAA